LVKVTDFGQSARSRLLGTDFVWIKGADQACGCNTAAMIAEKPGDYRHRSTSPEKDLP